MRDLAVFHGQVLLHLGPHRVGHGDAVAVEVHAEGRDDVGLGAESDGGAQRLAGQHVRAVELTVDHPVQQHLPVGLGFERHVQAFVFEVALFIGHHERGAVGQLDEAELQGLLFRACGFLRQGRQTQGRRAGQGQGVGGETAAVDVERGIGHGELLTEEKNGGQKQNGAHFLTRAERAGNGRRCPVSGETGCRAAIGSEPVGLK
ncbi:hypothetical protein D9M68_732000 [compost metagenome]